MAHSGFSPQAEGEDREEPHHSTGHSEYGQFNSRRRYELQNPIQHMYQYTACKTAATKHIIICIIPDSLEHLQHKRQHIFKIQTDLGTRNFKSAIITRLVPTLKLARNSLLSRNRAQCVSESVERNQSTSRQFHVVIISITAWTNMGLGLPQSSIIYPISL